MPRSVLVSLAFLSLLASALADETELDATESALIEAAAKCPVTLARALGHAYGSGRRPLKAEIVLDTEGRLLMQAWVRVEEEDAASIEAWIGPLSGGGWVPERRPLTDESLLAEASRLWALLEPDPNVLRKALHGAVGTKERAGAADLGLAIAPVAGDGERGVSLRVAIDGALRALRFDPSASTYALGAPEPQPERLPAYQAPALPPLEVPNGRWFQAEEPPTLEGWRGQPVLVVVTDPG